MEPTKPPPDPLSHMADWGRQTVALAMSLQSSKLGKGISGPERAQHAAKEASATTQDLWTAALSECKQPPQIAEMTLKFAQKIFDWSFEHMR